MLKVDPKDRPNVEDLLNLPHVSMRLREKALKKNHQHMKRKEEEVTKKEQELVEREALLLRKEQEMEERERQVEELERAQRLKKNSSGSSTNPGTDYGGNDSCIKTTGGPPLFNKSIDRGFFSSPGAGAPQVPSRQPSLSRSGEEGVERNL
jgi:hypothetical protein